MATFPRAPAILRSSENCRSSCSLEHHCSQNRTARKRCIGNLFAPYSLGVPLKDPPATNPPSPRTPEHLFEEACALSGSAQEVDEDIVHLAVELAEQLLKQARKRETRADESAREALSSILKSENNQRFSTALTDRIHRSHSPARTVKVFTALAERSGCGPELPKLDRIQLRAGRMFGALVP